MGATAVSTEPLFVKDVMFAAGVLPFAERAVLMRLKSTDHDSELDRNDRDQPSRTGGTRSRTRVENRTLNRGPEDAQREARQMIVRLKRIGRG
jgi:hypothetical protein